MASLTGSFIKDTYQSLLKLIDNGNVTSTAKEITDGEGNGTGIFIDTSGNVTATGAVQGSSVTNGTTSISELQTNKEDKSEKGAASGYAPLDVNSKVPTANLPDSVVGQVEYKGTWNASTNTPTLPSASGVKGNYYVVSVAGVYQTVDYEIGDWIISNGTQWEKVDNSDKVSSVNGATGVVVLDTDNISEGSTNQYYTSERANSDFDTRLATKDTDNLTEGSNLYYTDERVSANADVTANTAKTGITQAQADAIVANTAKNSYPSADALKLSGIAEGAEVNVQSDWNASSGDAFILNKPTTITTQQAADIVTNNAKVGITTQQASDITANNAKISFDSASSTKLAGIAENATNVTNNNQITNGAGYINEASQTAHTNAIGNAIDFSARVTLAGGVAEGTSGIIKNLQSIS
jgi:hypothetical protein